MNSSISLFESLIPKLEKNFSPEEIDEIKEFVSVDEYELAIETVCAIIIERTRAVDESCVQIIQQIIGKLELTSELTQPFTDRTGVLGIFRTDIEET